MVFNVTSDIGTYENALKSFGLDVLPGGVRKDLFFRKEVLLFVMRAIKES